MSFCVKKVDQVFAFAREAGGAQAIAPVLKDLRSRGIELTIAAKDVAVGIFEAHGFATYNLDGVYDSALFPSIEKLFQNDLPDVLLTSCASLPELDMTEKLLWSWAERHSLRSIAVLDQWQNYARRFGAANIPDIAYMPNLCCVMDDLAKKSMIDEGFPAKRIVVTGQPAFDSLVDVSASESEAVLSFKNDLGLDNGKPTIVFVSEALERDWESEYGYSERKCLNVLIDIIDSMSERPNLVIKKHPQNVDSDFDLDKIRLMLDEFVIRIVGTNIPAKHVVLASDLVVGMSSVLLVESIIMRVPTVSIEIGAKVFDKCFPVCIGAIPSITSIGKASSVIPQLLIDQNFRSNWLIQQAILNHKKGATQRVAELVLSQTYCDDE